MHMHANPTATSKEDASIHDYLAWMSSNSPEKREQEVEEWRLMEAERLDHRRDEELFLEVYGC